MTHTATWNGKVIAKSDKTLEVDGYVYFPRDTVRMELLTATPKTANDLKCPHGVQFYDVAEAGKTSARAAWSYEAPFPECGPVKSYVSFWGDEVEITATRS